MVSNLLVSIVVPSYNHSQYINECIESIFNQSYTNFELIVIDDGSKDNSVEILKKLKLKYDFKLIAKKNEGLSKSLNIGFKDHSNGYYLTFCASDDYWHKDKLKKQVAFLEDNQDYQMVFTKAYSVDHNSNTLENRTLEINKGLLGGDIFKEIILQKIHPPVNYLFRSSIIKKLGFYDEEIWAEDFDMNLRISEHNKIGFIDQFLFFYRQPEYNKNLNFKTIYSHRKSIEKFKHSRYYKTAIKKWHYKCFLWYAPYKKGKKIAFIGMVKNIDKFLTKEFLIFLTVLLRKWK